MDFSLSEEQKFLCDSIKNFARKKLNKDIFIDDRDSNFPREKWVDCGKFGIHGLPIPEEYEGQGQSMLNTALAVKSLAYGCKDEGLVFSICAHMLACCIPLWKHGSEYLKNKYLKGTSKGELICGNAISEAGAGSDVNSISTNVELVEDGYKLNGTKIFVSNGPVADLFFIYAKHKDGIKSLDTSVFVVEKNFKGIFKGQKFEKMGLRTCQLGEIVLDNCIVPSGNLLGRERRGLLVFNESMLWERVIMSAYHIGAMKQQYEIVVDYANKRKQFNSKIINFSLISDKLIEMSTRIELSELLLYRVCWSFDNKLLKNEDVSKLKIYVAESKVKNSLEAVQVFGAYGYLKESDVEKQLRDSIAAKIYSGTCEVNKKIISESLVKEDV